jgi:hypothetical protein
MSQSVDQAIAMLAQNQELLSKQVAQVITQTQFSQLTSVINSNFDTINANIAAIQSNINILNGQVALNPIPNFSDGEIPSGAINGINPNFELANTPVSPITIFVGSTPTAYGNFALQSVHYIVIGKQIQFQAGFIPATGSWIRAFYRY